MSFQALLSQLLVGLINGSFYALLSLGLALIFGLLHIINFAHGALYTMGAIFAWLLLTYAGVGYWPSLFLVPLAVGSVGAVIERTLLRRLAGVDPLYGFLLTFGLALIIQGLFSIRFGSSGLPYSIPSQLSGGRDLGFIVLPNYRTWVLCLSAFICFIVWYAIEKTKLGSYLRASTENPTLVRAFGVNVPLLVTATYAGGAALAGLAGVLAAPIYRVSPSMGANQIIVVFAVVVIGGMGSIGGAILTGFGLGLLEGLTRVVYPELSETVVFVLMALVLVWKPTGLFGRPLHG